MILGGQHPPDSNPPRVKPAADWYYSPVLRPNMPRSNCAPGAMPADRMICPSSVREIFNLCPGRTRRWACISGVKVNDPSASRVISLCMIGVRLKLHPPNLVCRAGRRNCRFITIMDR